MTDKSSHSWTNVSRASKTQTATIASQSGVSLHLGWKLRRHLSGLQPGCPISLHYTPRIVVLHGAQLMSAVLTFDDVPLDDKEVDLIGFH